MSSQGSGKSSQNSGKKSQKFSNNRGTKRKQEEIREMERAVFDSTISSESDILSPDKSRLETKSSTLLGFDQLILEESKQQYESIADTNDDDEEEDMFAQSDEGGQSDVTADDIIKEHFEDLARHEAMKNMNDKVKNEKTQSDEGKQCDVTVDDIIKEHFEDLARHKENMNDKEKNEEVVRIDEEMDDEWLKEMLEEDTPLKSSQGSSLGMASSPKVEVSKSRMKSSKIWTRNSVSSSQESASCSQESKKSMTRNEGNSRKIYQFEDDSDDLLDLDCGQKEGNKIVKRNPFDLNFLSDPQYIPKEKPQESIVSQKDIDEVEKELKKKSKAQKQEKTNKKEKGKAKGLTIIDLFGGQQKNKKPKKPEISNDEENFASTSTSSSKKSTFADKENAKRTKDSKKAKSSPIISGKVSKKKNQKMKDKNKKSPFCFDKFSSSSDESPARQQRITSYLGKRSKEMDEIDMLLAIPSDTIDMEKICAEADEKMRKASEFRRLMRLRNKQEQEERARQERINIEYRDRLDTELPPEKITELFQKYLPTLESIKRGETESWRHKNYTEKLGAGFELQYAQIEDPFTTPQIDYAIEEMKKVFLKNSIGLTPERDYVIKVLMPEFCIRMYQDLFNVSYDEAQLRIRQTPLRPELDPLPNM